MEYDMIQCDILCHIYCIISSYHIILHIILYYIILYYIIIYYIILYYIISYYIILYYIILYSALCFTTLLIIVDILNDAFAFFISLDITI